jgi:hypothetical protein
MEGTVIFCKSNSQRLKPMLFIIQTQLPCLLLLLVDRLHHVMISRCIMYDSTMIRLGYGRNDCELT